MKPYTLLQRSIYLESAINRRKRDLEKCLKISSRGSIEMEIKLFTELKRETDLKIKAQKENEIKSKLF